MIGSVPGMTTGAPRTRRATDDHRYPQAIEERTTDMSNFQDQLRQFEHASDHVASEESQQQALLARNRAEQIEAAHALRGTIDACITEARSVVPSMRTEHAATDQPLQEWTLRWKDGTAV